jgi:hypothetical protein
MSRHGLRHNVGILVVMSGAVGMFGGDISPTRAAEQETRVFTVKIDGTPAGVYKMTITGQDGQRWSIDCQADVSTRFLLRQVKYVYRGTEVWENGRLVHLKSETNDDGKSYRVLVQPEGNMLRVRVNGAEHLTRPDVWTTTYWRTPDPKWVNQTVLLLDCDNGKELRSSLQFLGAQQISGGGQVHNGEHYRIRGDVKVDAWYDSQHRLVRQESEEDGHRIVLELTRIDR